MIIMRTDCKRQITYGTDDESDAVAVGIAWLIGEGYLKTQEHSANMED